MSKRFRQFFGKQKQKKEKNLLSLSSGGVGDKTLMARPLIFFLRLPLREDTRSVYFVVGPLRRGRGGRTTPLTTKQKALGGGGLGSSPPQDLRGI